MYCKLEFPHSPDARMYNSTCSNNSNTSNHSDTLLDDRKWKSATIIINFCKMNAFKRNTNHYNYLCNPQPRDRTKWCHHHYHNCSKSTIHYIMIYMIFYPITGTQLFINDEKNASIQSSIKLKPKKTQKTFHSAYVHAHPLHFFRLLFSFHNEGRHGVGWVMLLDERVSIHLISEECELLVNECLCSNVC